MKPGYIYKKALRYFSSAINSLYTEKVLSFMLVAVVYYNSLAKKIAF